MIKGEKPYFSGGLLMQVLRCNGAGAGWSTGSTTRDWLGGGLGGMDGGFGGKAWCLWYTYKGCHAGFLTKLLGNNGKTNVEKEVSWLVGKKYVFSWNMTIFRNSMPMQIRIITHKPFMEGKITKKSTFNRLSCGLGAFLWGKVDITNTTKSA